MADYILNLLRKYKARDSIIGTILFAAALLEIFCGVCFIVGAIFPFALTLTWDWNIPKCGILLIIIALIEAYMGLLCDKLFGIFTQTNASIKRGKTIRNIIIVVGVALTLLLTISLACSIVYNC